MTKTLTDTPQDSGATRLREYTRQERESGTHPAVEVLRSRPQTRSEENRRTVEYLRIERGHVS
ncbi:MULTISPECIES: hypothetical protein [Paracoccus]|uniref:Uncharacterized protein n=1 Tax=Paracoccus fontiphilus TaxID=1815556 RepID=A0ABV7IC04_9RHOB|nr:hypothetical protein [Paracoccus fontiphilus]